MEKKKILIVDDTRLFLEMEKSFLEREELSIQTTNSGAEAVKIVKATKPDLVILDHHLPDMNGDMICRIIKADPTLRATKVIIVTGDDSAATRELYKGLGCGAVLNKPFTKSDINSTVGKVLGVGTRQIHRVNTVIPCLVRIGPGGYDCRILNISASGMYIEIDFLPEPGRNFEVEFIVPPSISPVQIKVVVMWTSEMVGRDIPRGIGVKFFQIPEDVTELIIDYIEDISPDS